MDKHATFVLCPEYNTLDFEAFSKGLTADGFNVQPIFLESLSNTGWLKNRLGWIRTFSALKTWKKQLESEVNGDVAIVRNQPIISATESDINVPIIAIIGGVKVPKLRYFDPKKTHLANFVRWYSIQYPLMYWWYRRMRAALNSSDEVIVNSEFMQDVVETNFGVSAVVIYPPIFVNNYQVPYNDDGTVGMVSPRHEKKGDDIFIQLARAMPDQKFRICGGVSDRITDDIAELENVVNDGWLNDMRKFYRSISCLVVPSRREAFGRVAAEAMVSGIPPLVSNAGGLPEVVCDNNLIVSNPEDIDEWKQKVIIALNNGKRADLQERAIRKFGAENQLESFVGIINQTLESAK